MVRTSLLVTGCLAAGLSAVSAPLFAEAWRKEAAVEVASLRTEYRENPLGLGTPKPRLSWQLRSSARGVTQSAYQVRVARSEQGLRAGGRDVVWDSGRVASDESIHRTYAGPPLLSGQRYSWQVRVWDASRPRLRLERPRLVGDGPPGTGRLEGELDRAGPGRRRVEDGAVADAAARVRSSAVPSSGRAPT